MGQKYVAYKESGEISGFYDSDDSPVPRDIVAYEITDELWRNLLKDYGEVKVIQRGADGEPEAVISSTSNADKIKYANSIYRDSLLSSASLAIAPLQDAVDLEVATDAELAQLSRWKQYRVSVMRTDLTVESPNWDPVPY